MSRSSLLDVALGSLPASTLARHRTKRGLRVLCYHGLSDEIAFRRQLEWLTRDFQPVSLGDVLDEVRGVRRLPAEAVLVTFDDGVRTQADIALPELARAGVPAVFFVVVGALESDEPFWWEAVAARAGVLGAFPLDGRTYADAHSLVRAMKTVPDEARRTAVQLLEERYGPAPRVKHMTTSDLHAAVSKGHAVGNHSLTHPLLDRCDDQTLEHELTESTRRFRESFPGADLTFAFPNGNWDGRTTSRLRDLGYELAFRFDHRIRGLEDPLGISRVRMSDAISRRRFVAITSGSHPWVHHVLGRP